MGSLSINRLYKERDLLWDLYRLSYRSVAPSLSAQLIYSVA